MKGNTMTVDEALEAIRTGDRIFDSNGYLNHIGYEALDRIHGYFLKIDTARAKANEIYEAINDGHSYAELGRHYDLTRERIRQIYVAEERKRIHAADL